MKIGFVLFPDLTQLDLTGPLQILSRLPDAEVHLAAASLDPVPTDTVLAIPPTDTFETCPPLDLLCAPGGFGVDQAMNDPALVEFVRRQARTASHVTAVCTGAFILGAAGLLRGRRATTHWAYHDALAGVGAIPVRARSVRDGNIVTAGGVTSGIDFALELAAEIAGEDAARAIQLGLEYDPAPPFDCGSPERAGPRVMAAMQSCYDGRLTAFRAALAEALGA